MKGLPGKVAIVTGGASGPGEAIASAGRQDTARAASFMTGGYHFIDGGHTAV